MKAATLKNAPPVSARALDEWFPELPEALEKAVSDYGLAETSDWQPLDELSSATRFEEIETDGESAIYESGRFVAPASVHVTLVYEPNSDEPTEMADSYPARVYFKIVPKGKNKRPSVAVDRIEVDTASFYE